MRTRQLLLAAVALLAPGAASATSIAILPPGTLTAPAGFGSVATFDGQTPTTYGQTTPTGPFSDGGAQFSGGGIVMNNFGQGSDGLYATPFGDTTNYMAVLGGQTETITYSSPETRFGLYWGSVDTYNALSFYNGANLVATVTGSQTGPLLADGGQGDYASNGYVLITALPAFDKVLVLSSSNSFEFDNVAAGAPEPSTWAMLMIGFVGLGSAALHRGRKNRLAVALA